MSGTAEFSSPPHAGGRATLALLSRIDRVTVYERGALVSRLAELPPGGPPGGLEVRLSGLPLALDDRSVRVSVEQVGPGSAPGTAVDVRVALDAVDLALDLGQDLVEIVDAARREERAVRAVFERIEQQLSRLGGLDPGPRPQPRPGRPPIASPADARLALLAFRDALHDGLVARRQEVERELAHAAERRVLAEDRLARASTERQAREHELRKALVVSVEPGDAPGLLRVEYLVPGARWVPAYVLRLDPQFRQARLGLRAQVRQRTGEDWSAVSLVLSTAEATRWAELPELRALRIGRRRPPAARRGWRPAPAGVDELFADYDASFGTTAAPAFTAPPLRPPAAHPVEAAVMEPPAELAVEALMEEEVELAADDDAMPAPAVERAAPAPRSRSFTAGLTRAPAPQAAAPSPKMAKARRAGPPVASGAAAPGRLEPPPEPPEIGVPDDLLDYAGLRMQGPDDAGRGRLAAVGPVQLYQELLKARGGTARTDLGQVLDQAREAALAVGDDAPPPQHRFPASEGGFDYAYEAEHRVDVPADGAFHAVPLLERACAARLRHVCVPRETQDVFRELELDNPLDAPLLPGPVDVYVDDVWLAGTRLDLVPQGGRVTLGLGVEQAVKVARNVRFEEQSGGLVIGHQELRHAVTVDLHNHLSVEAAVEVRERIPVAPEDEKDVSVDVTEVSPPWEAWEPERRPLPGGHRWVVTLAPGSGRILKLAYRIRIPNRHELVDGNRRES